MDPDDQFNQQRQKMVTQQLEKRGITNARVLDALAQVPREMFVPRSQQAFAYDDRALPLPLEQTISQPYTVAFMCESLQLAPDDVVLEIGTGSGYGAAVLAQLAAEVHTVERLPDLADSARARLEEMGYDNVSVHVGDGTLGWPQAAPYDAICVTAGGDRVPEAYLRQLADHGRILIPLSDGSGHQVMTRITRDGDQWKRERLGTFAFVPLVGAEQQSRS